MPEQRLCEPGQTSEAWMREQLTVRGAQAVFDELAIGAPMVWCEPDGTEKHGTLKHLLVQKIEVDGDRILRARDWLERGSTPRMDPKAASWRVDLLTGPQPVTVLLTHRRSD